MTKKEMSFLDHLEELRWHLVRSFAAIFVIAIIIGINIKYVYKNFLAAHLNADFVTYTFLCKTFSFIGIDTNFCSLTFDDTLQSTIPTQQLMTAVWASLILGFVIAFPYVLWEIWRFIAPGLHPSERKKSKGFIFWASVLFFFGILFSFYIILPMSVYFFTNFSLGDTVQNRFTIGSYMSLITNTLVGVAIFFELPIVIFFLSKVGLISPEFLKKYRKHALVVVLILSAIITPPDVASQVIVAVPIMILYEISIYVSKYVIKKQEKAIKKEIAKTSK